MDNRIEIPFDPEKYVKIYRDTYSKKVGALNKELEDRIRSAMNTTHVFDILKSIDSLSEDIGGAKILRKYGLGPKMEDREGQEDSYAVKFSGNYNNMAEMLKDFRKQADLTRTDVSRLSGVSMRAVNYHEDGEHKPTRKVLKKYLSMYCIEPPEAIEEIEKMLK